MPERSESDVDRYDAAIDLDGPTSHAKVVGLVGSDRRVLELGAATGRTTRALQENGCTVVAVEGDPKGAARASPWAERVVAADLDTIDLGGAAGSGFNAVVAADVLEHLRDPLRLLSQVPPLLGEDGRLVVSVPNIAHGSVRLSLLQGRFDYADTGLLDRTHLRFFTRRSLVALLAAAGFVVDQLDVVELPVEHPWAVPFDPLAVPAAARELVDSDPSATAYQYVVVAAPAPPVSTVATSAPGGRVAPSLITVEQHQAALLLQAAARIEALENALIDALAQREVGRRPTPTGASTGSIGGAVRALRRVAGAARRRGVRRSR